MLIKDRDNGKDQLRTDTKQNSGGGGVVGREGGGNSEVVPLEQQGG